MSGVLRVCTCRYLAGSLVAQGGFLSADEALGYSSQLAGFLLPIHAYCCPTVAVKPGRGAATSLLTAPIAHRLVCLSFSPGRFGSFGWLVPFFWFWVGQAPGSASSDGFFQHQMMAFQVWLQFAGEVARSGDGVMSQRPPEQLPVVLQVLLSQVRV